MGKVEGTASHWTADPPAVWLDETVGQVLARQATATPDAPAVHWLGDDGLVTWTYGDLRDRSARVVRAMRAAVDPGARVAVCAPNSLEWVAAFFAAAQLGATFVPVNPAMGERELEQIFSLTAPDLVLGVESFRGVAVGDSAAGHRR